MTIPRPTPEQLELWMRDTTGPLVYADHNEEPTVSEVNELDRLRARVATQAKVIEGNLAALTVGWNAVKERDRLRAENERLSGNAPGTPGAVVAALFEFAQRECGHDPTSARHALTTVEEWVARAKADRDQLRALAVELAAALDPFAEYGRHFPVTALETEWSEHETVLMEVTDAPNIDVGDCRRAAEVHARAAVILTPKE